MNDIGQQQKQQWQLTLVAVQDAVDLESYFFFSIFQVHCISCENKNDEFCPLTRSQQQHTLVCTFLHRTLILFNKAPIVDRFVIFQVLEHFDDIERLQRL